MAYPRAVEPNPTARRAANARSSTTSRSGAAASAIHSSSDDAHRRGRDRGDQLQLLAADRFGGHRTALERVDDGGLPTVLVLGLVGLQLGRLLHDLRPGDERGAVVAVVEGEHTHRGDERGEGAGVGGLIGQDREQPFPPRVGVAEEGVLLGGEVAEERAGRHLAGVGDLLDGRAVEALAAEEVQRGFLQGLAGAGLLPFPEAHGGGHDHILAQKCSWQQLKFVSWRSLAVAARIDGRCRSSPPPPTTHTAEQAYARRWWTLAVLCLSLLIVFVGNSSLNVALPTLSRDLGATESQLQWVVAAYSLVFAGLLFTTGALGDRFGRKGALQFGLVTSSSPARRWRRSRPAMWQLIACRAVMGVGAAFIMPSTLSILVNVFPARERAKAIAIWASDDRRGRRDRTRDQRLVLGHFWFGSVFLVNVPIIVLGARRRVVLRAQVARPRAGQPRPDRRAAVDRRHRPRSSSGSSRRPRTAGTSADDARRVRGRRRRPRRLRLRGSSTPTSRCSTCTTSATPRSARAAAA